MKRSRSNCTSKGTKRDGPELLGDSQGPCGCTLGEDTGKPSWGEGGGSKIPGRAVWEVKVPEQGVSWTWMTVMQVAENWMDPHIRLRGALFRCRLFHRCWEYMTPSMVRKRPGIRQSEWSFYSDCGVQWCCNQWVTFKCISYNKLKMMSTNS